MPRKNLSFRTTKKLCTDSYDNTKDYTSCITENAYTAKDSLILWSNFCKSAGKSAKLLGGQNYQEIASDRSADVTELKIYAPNNGLTSTGTFVITEENLITILPYFGSAFSSILTPESVDLCGNPCYWLNVSSAVPDPKSDCIGKANGANHLYVGPNPLINFSNNSATVDEPFSISVWYYPIDFEGNQTALYDRGGNFRGQSPAIFHKTFQYALYQRECGKLEFVLYDIGLSASEDDSLASGSTYDFSGTQATLSVRSDENVLKPGEWNHITVTYDGSGTRGGMKIYVNCDNRTNRADDPNNYGSSLRTSTLNDGSSAEFEAIYDQFLTNLYFGPDSDDENPAHYTAMHSFSTPLLFASTALPVNAYSILSLSPTTMSSRAGTQLPNSFIFDIGIWTTALTEENVKAVCDATRNCTIQFSSEFASDSGYISLSPKIRKKIIDEKDNSLSVIDRIGDRSDRRVKQRSPYDDQDTIVFGKRITDDLKKGRFRFAKLNLSDDEINYGIPSTGIIPDTKVWQTTNALIKREQKIGTAAAPVYDNALTFARPSLSSIETVQSFNNAIIRYDLILGPYNQKPGYLALKSPSAAGSELTVSVTTDGLNYKTIRSHVVTGSTSSQQEFYSVQNSTLLPTQHNFRKSFKIHFTEIDTSGEPYKIRFESLDQCWGIGRIDIISSDEDVRYPVLINHDSKIGKKIDSDFIATPHTRSDLTAKNKSVRGITDSYILFNDSKTQNINPFDDNEALPFVGSTFFDFGVSKNVMEGFSSQLKDKTSFTITLSSSAETDIGIINKTSGVDEIGGAGEAEDTLAPNLGHPINAAWNNKTKRYQALQQGFMSVVYKTDTDRSIRESNRVPFSSIDIIASASATAGEDPVQYGSELLSSYAQPISSFGFPTHSTYTLPVQDHDGLISLSDYITKPFALEKIIVEFDARFEFAGSSSESATGAVVGHRALYSENSATGPSTRTPDNNVILIPSFYLLKVNKNSSKLFSQDYIIDNEGLLSFTGSIDSTADYDSNGLNHTSCEMISYGQMTLFLTGSGTKVIDMEKAIETGLGRDAVYDIRELNGDHLSSDSWRGSGIAPITSSFRIEFPVRSMPKTDFTSRTYYKDSGGDFFAIIGANKAGGRAATVITGSSMNAPIFMPTISNRGLLNNLGSIDGKDKRSLMFPDSETSRLPYNIETSGHLIENEKTSISPYILFPEDKISANFSYPVPTRGIFAIPGSTDKRLNKMTLCGITKIHLYGSGIKNGVEFHENMNQALTTREVSEPIGCEAVVDQFFIQPRDEYYKTYFDRDPLFAGVHLASGGSFEILASYKNIIEADDAILATVIRKNTSRNKRTLQDIDRIGLENGSIVNRWDSYNHATASFASSNTFDLYINPRTQPLIGSPPRSRTDTGTQPHDNILHLFKRTFTFPYFDLYESKRRYADEGPKGTIGLADGISFSYKNTKQGKLQKTVARSKYIFKHNHFGFFADIISCAVDGKYNLFNSDGDPLNYGDNSNMSTVSGLSMFNSAPVNVKFVSGSIDSKNNKVFYQVSPASISSDLTNKTVDSSVALPYFTDDSTVALNWNSGL